MSHFSLQVSEIRKYRASFFVAREMTFGEMNRLIVEARDVPAHATMKAAAETPDGLRLTFAWEIPVQDWKDHVVVVE